MRRRKTRVKKAKDASEWRALLITNESINDDDGIRRMITDVEFSQEHDRRVKVPLQHASSS